MSVTIEKKVLVGALRRAKPTLSSGKLVEILKDFCFKDGNLHTHNGVAGIRTVSPLPKEWDFAVPGDRLFSICSKMPEDITMSLSDGGRLTIMSGGNRTWVATVKTRGFPEIQTKGHETLTSAGNLKDALGGVAFCSGRDARKPHFLGVALRDRFAYTTDGLRCARFMLDDPCLTPVNLPGSSVDHIRSLGNPDMMTKVNDTVGMFYRKTKTFYTTQTLVGEFPFDGIDKLVSNHDNEFITEFPEESIAALDRVQHMAPEESEIIIENTDEGLVIRSATKNVGAAMETIPWEFKRPFKVAVRCRFMMTALQRTLTADLSDVCQGGYMMKFFTLEGFDHAMATMTLRE